METQEYRLMNQLEDTHWWFVSKRNFAEKYLNLASLSSKSKILDIGCGTGRNLQMLAQYGQVSGIEASKLAVKYCHQKGFQSVKLASAESLPFKAQVFNLVTLFDVLYHKGVKNDLRVLRQTYRILKPRGFILITDCAYQWLYGPHDKAMHARQRYSKRELEYKLKQAGFKIKKSSHIYSLTFPFFLINRLLSKYLKLKSSSDVSPVPRLINQLFILLLKFEANLLPFVKPPFGSSIIILAQK